MQIIKPEWLRLDDITAFTTTRIGGVSKQEYGSLNFSYSVGDKPEAVDQNFRLLNLAIDNDDVIFPRITQVHGITALNAAEIKEDTAPEADAIYTYEKNVVCSVLTADCLPILVCNLSRKFVACIHAGWKGLLNGVIPNCLTKLHKNYKNTIVWIGPAIMRDNYEVKKDLYNSFRKQNADYKYAFLFKDDKIYFDMQKLATMQLMKFNFRKIYYSNICTYANANQFFSYRRNKVTGRMITVICMS